MAQLSNSKIISGLVGNVVFQNRNGKQIIKSRPAQMKQTKATKSSAGEFGKCSTWAKQLRLGLLPFLVNLNDSSMYQRFTARVYEALLNNTVLPKGQRTLLNSDMSSLIGFEFNNHSPFEDYCRVPITATLDNLRQVTVTIPALTTTTDVLYPTGCTDAELVLYITANDFSPASPIATHHFIVPLPLSNTPQPETVWTSPVLPENCLIIVTAKLLYYEANAITGRNYLNSKTLNPAIVVLGDISG
jgi:hypothetical protein